MDKLIIGFFFEPEVIITEHFSFKHISAALIFEIMPPLPCLDASPAISIILLFIFKTFSTRRAFSFFDGGFVYNPSTFDKRIKQSALISFEILAAKISLSPNLISSVAVVSFSLIIGIQPSFNRLSKVAIAFEDDFLFCVSVGLVGFVQLAY